MEVEALNPPLPPHLPATGAAEATEIVKTAVALCLPALGVKEPAGSLLRWGSGQKSATEKLGSVALSTAGAVSTRPAVQKKGKRIASRIARLYYHSGNQSGTSSQNWK